jgi:hypothetical protein
MSRSLVVGGLDAEVDRLMAPLLNGVATELGAVDV